MECPFCAETIKDEALVCRHCSRDLRVARPVLLEIQELASGLDKVRQEIDRVGVNLERLKHPFRFYLTYCTLYIAAPAIVLVISHIFVTIVFNIEPFFLRLASLMAPVPFGFLTYTITRIHFRGAFLLGLLTATISVFLMLVVTAVNDDVPIFPVSKNEWREVAEYVASICLAFSTGNLSGILIFQVLPDTLSGGGRPNAAAFKLARLLGQYVGEDQLRRRARLIQNLLQTVGPLVGIAATAVGSVYSGLKGVIGH